MGEECPPPVYIFYDNFRATYPFGLKVHYDTNILEYECDTVFVQGLDVSHDVCIAN